MADQYIPRLKRDYDDRIVQAMIEKFGSTHPMAGPRPAPPAPPPATAEGR